MTEVSMTPELSLGAFHVRYEGAAGGDGINATKLFLGVGATFMVTARPIQGIPLGLTVATRLRANGRTRGTFCTDCVDPAHGSIAEARLQAGISYVLHGLD